MTYHPRHSDHCICKFFFINQLSPPLHHLLQIIPFQYFLHIFTTICVVALSSFNVWSSCVVLKVTLSEIHVWSNPLFKGHPLYFDNCYFRHFSFSIWKGPTLSFYLFYCVNMNSIDALFCPIHRFSQKVNMSQCQLEKVSFSTS